MELPTCFFFSSLDPQFTGVFQKEVPLGFSGLGLACVPGTVAMLVLTPVRELSMQAQPRAQVPRIGGRCRGEIVLARDQVVGSVPTTNPVGYLP